jgi:hypothetical protein
METKLMKVTISPVGGLEEGGEMGSDVSRGGGKKRREQGTEEMERRERARGDGDER